jgi:predicted nucleic acid-binding protein
MEFMRTLFFRTKTWPQSNTQSISRPASSVPASRIDADTASVYRRETSREWWNKQAGSHSLYISAEVLAELAHPGFRRSKEALVLVRDVPLLPITDDVRGFAELLVREKAMPAPVAGDAIHVAVAVVHGMDYLLSWNVRHLANPNKLAHLRTLCLRSGLMPPQIVTPDLLWEDRHEED